MSFRAVQPDLGGAACCRQKIVDAGLVRSVIVLQKHQKPNNPLMYKAWSLIAADS